MLSTYERKKIGGCFYPFIYLNCSWDEVYWQLEVANRTEKAVRQMLDGKITAEEMLEQIEDCFEMDLYLDEVEANLEEVCQQIIWLE